jgi:hypothetical protein
MKAHLQQLHQQVQCIITGMWEHVRNGLGLQDDKHTEHMGDTACCMAAAPSQLNDNSFGG